MHLVVRPSVPVLAPLVESFWYYDEPMRHGREWALPTGDMGLLVNLWADELGTFGPGGCRVGGAALQGVASGPAVIDAAQQRRIAGVSFRPGGAYPFLAAPASEARDALVGLDDLWGRDGAVLRDRLLSTASACGAPAGEPGEQRTALAVLRELESVLVGRLARAELEPDPAVGFALAAFERGAGVLQVAERTGLSRRTLATRFAARIGLAPKRFARVRRFQRVLRAVAGDASPDWARVAVEHGYYDQAHLINEFRALSGLRPGEYRPRSPGERNHVPISPIAGPGPGPIMGA
jgi:AraC-like DNA-binding protein